MKLRINHSYACGAIDVIDLLCAWDDVDEWWIKNQRFYFTRKGSNDIEEIDMPPIGADAIECKYPVNVSIQDEETGEDLHDELE